MPWQHETKTNVRKDRHAIVRHVTSHDKVIGTAHRVVGTGTCPGTTKQTKCALPEIRLGRPISGPEAPLINIGLCPAACPATPPSFQN